MSGLDVVLLLVAVLWGIGGWGTGLISTAGSIAGFVGGSVLGLRVMPQVVDALGLTDRPQATQGVVLVGGALVLGLVGQALFGVVAARLARTAYLRRNGRRIDGALGAMAGATIALVVAWALATGLRPLFPPSWSRAVVGSQVLATVDRLMPRPVADAVVRARAGTTGFPQVFRDLTAEPIAPVAPPALKPRITPAVAAAQASVVRIVGQATACNRVETGSGWVVARGRVVTNAHVVAGSSSVTVSSGGTGMLREARVVAMDPRLDLAVLDVPGLPVRPLRVGPDLRQGGDGLIAGFPLGGTYTVGGARVRQTIVAAGADIYGRGDVVRQVYSLYGTVQPGNSGGPLLDSSGRVVGTIFARSLDDPRTGYALTGAQTAEAIRDGLRSTAPVDTGACAKG